MSTKATLNGVAGQTPMYLVGCYSNNPGMVFLTQTSPITAVWTPRLPQGPTVQLMHAVARAGRAELRDLEILRSFPTPNSKILVL